MPLTTLIGQLKSLRDNTFPPVTRDLLTQAVDTLATQAKRIEVLEKDVLIAENEAKLRLEDAAVMSNAYVALSEKHAAQARLLELAGTLAGAVDAWNDVPNGADCRLELTRLAEALDAFAAAQAEYQTTGKVPCPECGEILVQLAAADDERDAARDERDEARRQLAEAQDQATGKVPCPECEVHANDLRLAAGELRVSIPEPGTDAARMLKANSLLKAERDDLRRQLAEAERFIDSLTESHAASDKACLEARADNAALIATLESTLDNYAPMGGNGRTCEECDGFDSHIDGCRMFPVAETLSQPHPGAGLLEELVALRKVERIGRSLGDYNADTEFFKACDILDAIRNRKDDQ